MNIVDYCILGVIGLSVLFGFYRGFIQSVLNTGACVLAFIGSFFLYPTMADAIQNNQAIVRTLMHYTDASSRVGDLDLALSKVSEMTTGAINSVLENVKLPDAISNILSFNMENQVYSPIGATTVSDYVNQTILTVCINVISFIVCFIALFIVLSIVINLIKAVFRFPLLRQLDWLAGGIFGALRGVLLCFALFLLVPIVNTIAPIQGFQSLISESSLAAMFDTGTLITSIMNRTL